MFEINRYSADEKCAWNGFIDLSKNGTFLFNRNYMDYHADRFHDFSLMFYCKGKLFAVLPANIRNGVLYSHQGLTYGGLVTNRSARAANICSLFKELNGYLKENGVRKVVYKALPWIYSKYMAEEDLYALTNVCHANIVSRDISSTIVLDNRLGFSELRRRGRNRARACGVVIESSDDVAAFWNILDNNLESKYGVAPVHSCAELELLMGRFPSNIKLYMAYLDGEALGGVIVYLCNNVVHTQYISASPEGKRMGALDLLFDTLIDSCLGSFKYFDFGRSTEHGGRYLNESLIFQKEGFGGRGVCYDTYEWTL